MQIYIYIYINVYVYIADSDTKALPLTAEKDREITLKKNWPIDCWKCSQYHHDLEMHYGSYFDYGVVLVTCNSHLHLLYCIIYIYIKINVRIFIHNHDIVDKLEINLQSLC